MKDEAAIIELRKSLLDAVVKFGRTTSLEFHGTMVEPEELHFFGLGALAFAAEVLELDRPPNLANAIKSMRKHAAACAHCGNADAPHKCADGENYCSDCLVLLGPEV